MFRKKKENLNCLLIYMKSGNKIFTDNILDYKVNRDNDGKTNYMQILYSVETPPKYRLKVGTVDLSQIEAVVEC